MPQSGMITLAHWEVEHAIVSRAHTKVSCEHAIVSRSHAKRFSCARENLHFFFFAKVPLGAP